MRRHPHVLATHALSALLGCAGDGDGSDPDPGDESCLVVDADVVVTSRDDLADMPRPCFTVPGHTVTVEASELEELSGLDGLREVRRLVIRGNPSLLTTEGLTKVRVLSELRVEDNPVLFELTGLSATEALDRLSLVDNPHLAHLSGLAKLKVIQGELSIEGESNLGDLEHAWGGGEAPSLLEQVGAFRVLETRGLQSAGLPLLKQVTADLLIQGNQDLQSLGTFTMLSEVGGNFVIQANPVLATVNTFTLKLQRIGGCLVIKDNPSLESIFDFQWVHAIGCQMISGNGFPDPT